MDLILKISALLISISWCFQKSKIYKLECAIREKDSIIAMADKDAERYGREIDRLRKNQK